MSRTQEIATRLGLHRAGREFRGACPVCGYADAFALTQREGRTLARCASCQDQAAIARLIGAAAGFSGPPTLIEAQSLDSYLDSLPLIKSRGTAL